MPLLALLLIGCGGVNQTVSRECKLKSAEFDRYIEKAKTLGFITFDGSWKAYEVEWVVLSHSQKVNLAIAIYCDAADLNGRAAIAIYGYNGGKKLASVVDGHYSD
ncbi:hypothetical protein [Maritalea sp.]|jgi:hypothetical protein|uniref:hypothetical protein n=1 Tax=Maritalea sp. TaxID=2003361 RepID=UPI0039E25414